MSRRNLGGVYRRGLVWWIHYSVNGTLVRESAETTDRDTAVDLLRDRQRDAALRRRVRSAFSFENLQQLLLDDYALNERASTPRARLAFKQLAAVFGGQRADAITSPRLADYARLRKDEGAAAASVRMELALLRRAMRLARRSGHLHGLPEFPTITVHNVRAGFFEPAAWQAVRAHLSGVCADLAEWLYLTGWRRGDALGLQWRQVDLDHGAIVLERGTTKNREGRVLPYRASPRLEAVIRSRRMVTDELERGLGRIVPWVFATDQGGRVTPARLRGAWERARAAAGQPGALLHDFRRTAARRYVRAGVLEKVAMKLLGQKTRAIFDRYNIVSETDLEDALRLDSTVKDPVKDRTRKRVIPGPGHPERRAAKSLKKRSG